MFPASRETKVSLVSRVCKASKAIKVIEDSLAFLALVDRKAKLDQKETKVI